MRVAFATLERLATDRLPSADFTDHAPRFVAFLLARFTISPFRRHALYLRAACEYKVTPASDN